MASNDFKNKNIAISMCRISGDSKYLDLIIDCSRDYYFTDMHVHTIYYEGRKKIEKDFDLSDQFQIEMVSKTEAYAPTHYTLRIDIAATFGLEGVPAIYVITFKAPYIYTKDGEYAGFPVPFASANYYNKDGVIVDSAGTVCTINGETAIYYNAEEEVCYDDESFVWNLTDIAICSDVNNVYRCLLQDILNDDPCKQLPDDAIRNYLILYGHQAAMSVQDLETASEYLRIISNCFSNCGGTSVCGCGSSAYKNLVPKPNGGCNCGK